MIWSETSNSIKHYTRKETGLRFRWRNDLQDLYSSTNSRRSSPASACRAGAHCRDRHLLLNVVCQIQMLYASRFIVLRVASSKPCKVPCVCSKQSGVSFLGFCTNFNLQRLFARLAPLSLGSRKIHLRQTSTRAK